MIEFELKSRTQPVGKRKGQTVYYAQPKTQQRMTTEMLIDRVVRESTLSDGDVKCALACIGHVVCDALKMGMSVDIGEIGTLRLTVTSKMMDTPEEVTADAALNTPKISFFPKQRMRDAAKSVTLSIDRSRVTPANEGGSTPGGGSPSESDDGNDGGL